MRRKTIARLFVIDVGLFTASGAFEVFRHYTTALLLFFAAILLFCIATAFALHRVISKRRTTPTVKGPLEQRIDTAAQPSFSPPQWTEYQQDIFYDVIWRWGYRPDIDNVPRSIKPFCPECLELTQLTADGQIGGNEAGGPKQWVLTCPSGDHLRPYTMPARLGVVLEMFPDIKQHIQQKLADGSWVEVVNRQRTVKGIAPINVRTIAASKLDEIAEQVLIILWDHRESALTCEEKDLEKRIQFLQLRQAKPEIDRALLDHHLTYLVDEEYVHLEVWNGFIFQYSLISKGREYIIANNLRNTDWYRYLREAQGKAPTQD